MKKYILYHANCPDGLGAALAAYLIFGDMATYIPVTYGNPPPDMEDGAEVFIVDFSYPRAMLESLAARVTLRVLDHHATAEKELAGLPYCTFDMAKSGAVLAWERFHPAMPVPWFFSFLQDRDLWQFKLPASREFSAALGSYPFDLKFWSAHFSKWDHEACVLLREEGVACLRLKSQQVDNMAQHHRWARFSLSPYANESHINFCDWPEGEGICDRKLCLVTAPVANATCFYSEVGERLLEMFPHANFAAYYMDRGEDNKRQWGLCSRPDFDCSVIAKAFGGGGHKQAAGFVQDL